MSFDPGKPPTGGVVSVGGRTMSAGRQSSADESFGHFEQLRGLGPIADNPGELGRIDRQQAFDIRDARRVEPLACRFVDIELVERRASSRRR